MKKMLSVVLILCLILPFLGCESKEDDILFFYARTEVMYGEADGVIASEPRDVTGHETDLTYLLMLYLQGPHSQALKAPFPKSTTLTELEVQDGNLTVVLSEAFGHLEGLDLTIACTCIAYTCFSISDCESVMIQSTLSGAPSMTLNRDSVTLADNSGVTEAK